jgi:predicted ester cyclase
VTNGATVAANKRRIREFIRRAFNEHDASAIAETFAPDIKWHGGILGTIEGTEGMTDLLTKFVDALPDLKATELRMVADEDTVWVNLTFEGTHEGELFGIPGTGHEISWHETDIFRLVDGMVVEEWFGGDVTNMLYQLGAYTPPWLS